MKLNYRYRGEASLRKHHRQKAALESAIRKIEISLELVKIRLGLGIDLTTQSRTFNHRQTLVSNKAATS